MSHEIRVFTFKEGLLSRVAHDLRLHAGRVTITVEGETVQAQIDPRSLVVDGVMRGARLDREGLGRSDRAKIVDTIQTKVLDTRRHPSVDFEGSWKARGDGGVAVDGELGLVGRRRRLSFALREVSGRWTSRITLCPSAYGIAPYRALAGAIRLQDRVIVELDLESWRPDHD